MSDADEGHTLGGRSHAPELPLPYFEAWRGEATPTRARLLLVSPHFTPDASVGALRWERFAAHFAERGWKLDVLARDPSQLERAEPERLERLPTGTRAYGVGRPQLTVDRLEAKVRRLIVPLRRLAGARSKRAAGAETSGDEGQSRRGDSGRTGWLTPEEAEGSAWTPRGGYRMYRGLRNLRQGAARAERAVSLATSLALTVDYRAVVSCGPPHWAHEAARRIAREIDRPLVLDFRDPWSLLEGLPEDIASPLWLRHAERTEAACVAEARLVVVTTDPHREALARRHPAAEERIVTVRNGIDPEELPEATEPPERFLVVYAGSVYGGRDPRPFLRAAARVVDGHGLGPDEFGIEFVGDASSREYGALELLAAEEGLEDHFEAAGPLPRHEALRRAARASVLLNLPQTSCLCIPAKVYEYLQMEGRILALEEPGSATERLLREEDADIVRPDDVEAIARVLRDRYEAFASEGRTRSRAPDPSLGRAAQAERFVRLLEDRVASTPDVAV